MAVNLIHNKWRITRRIGGGSFGERDKYLTEVMWEVGDEVERS